MTRKSWTLLTVCLATLMLMLDMFVVNTALPRIQRDLGAGFTDLQWVVDAYALALAACVLTGGSLADRLGRRTLFTVGLGVFTGSSLVCALAPTIGVLDAARAVQGIGAGVMFAVSLALLAHQFHGPELATALGVYGATFGVGAGLGPLVGGVLTEAFGWRTIFYLNLPLGAAAIALTRAKLAESRDPRPGRIDWAGQLSFTAGLAALVYALLRGNAQGWTSPTILGLLIGAAVLLVGFVAIQARTASPMLPLSLFRNPAFAGTQLAAFAISASLFALFLYIGLYLQNILGHDPLHTGLEFLPVTMPAVLVGPLAAKAMPRIGPRVLLATALAFVGAGLALMSGRTGASDWTSIVPGLTLAGIGAGISNPVIADLALRTVPRNQSGVASGIMDTFRQVGIAVGVAGLGAIYLAAGQQHLTAATGLPGSQARALLQAAAAGQLPAADGQLAAAARTAFLTGFNQILLIGAGVAAAGAVLALLLIRADNPHPAGPPENRVPTDHREDHQSLRLPPTTHPSPPRTPERS